MARSNYQFKKRQKELARKKKKELKRQRKQNKNTETLEENLNLAETDGDSISTETASQGGN